MERAHHAPDPAPHRGSELPLSDWGTGLGGAWQLAGVPDQFTVVVPGAVAALEPELFKHSEGRGVPGAHCGPEATTAGGDGGVQDRGRCLRRVSTAVNVAEQLIGNLRLCQGGAANDQPAVPDRVALLLAYDGERGDATGRCPSCAPARKSRTLSSSGAGTLRSARSCRYHSASVTDHGRSTSRSVSSSKAIDT